MLDPDDSRRLEALRELLNPRVVAAWLDEVEEHREQRDAAPAKAMTSEVPERLLTAKETCERLQVGRSWLYERARRTGFPVIRMGKSLRFRLSEVEGWLTEHSSE